jgi:hypothetical protein
LEFRVVGFDAVGREVLAGPLEELPKRIVITGTRELKKLGTSVPVGLKRIRDFCYGKP